MHFLFCFAGFTFKRYTRLDNLSHNYRNIVFGRSALQRTLLLGSLSTTFPAKTFLAIFKIKRLPQLQAIDVACNLTVVTVPILAHYVGISYIAFAQVTNNLQLEICSVVIVFSCHTLQFTVNKLQRFNQTLFDMSSLSVD